MWKLTYIGPDGNVQDFETPVASTGLGNGIGEFCEAGYMEPYWLEKNNSKNREQGMHLAHDFLLFIP